MPRLLDLKKSYKFVILGFILEIIFLLQIILGLFLFCVSFCPLAKAKRQRIIPELGFVGLFGLRGFLEFELEDFMIENEINKSDDRFLLAQKAGGIGTFDWNIETNEITWTDELDKIYGLPSGSFKGKYKNWIELIYPEDKERVKDEQKKSIKHHKDWNDFFRIIWPDKSIHWIKAQAITTYNKENQPIRMIGVNFDVTDLV